MSNETNNGIATVDTGKGVTADGSPRQRAERVEYPKLKRVLFSTEQEATECIKEAVAEFPDRKLLIYKFDHAGKVTFVVSVNPTQAAASYLADPSSNCVIACTTSRGAGAGPRIATPETFINAFAGMSEEQKAQIRAMLVPATEQTKPAKTNGKAK